jgi:hypothetical protein
LNHQKLPEKARLSGAISIGSVRNRTPLYDKKGLVSEEEFKRVMDPAKMVKPYVASNE